LSDVLPRARIDEEATAAVATNEISPAKHRERSANSLGVLCTRPQQGLGQVVTCI
jgi:hypothetical protein